MLRQKDIIRRQCAERELLQANFTLKLRSQNQIYDRSKQWIPRRCPKVKNQSFCSYKNVWKVVLGLAVLWYVVLVSAFAQQTPDSQQLVDAVHKASDLSQLGPYVLTARVVVNPGDNKREQVGTLTISRDHDLSRDELKIN